jgi:ABC-type nitrate/sulfonate/bicarbonate transport system substrate-binding protein
MKTRGGKRLAAQCTSFVSKTLHILIVLFAVASDSFLDTESITAQTQPLQKVSIAYASSGINYADIFLAKEMGFYREEGLEPQFIQMNSGIAITAGISGELDGQASIGSAIRGAPTRRATARCGGDSVSSSLLACGSTRIPIDQRSQG